MANSVLNSIALQRKGLQTEISALEDRVRAIRLDMDKLDQAEATLRGMSLTTFKTVGVRPLLLGKSISMLPIAHDNSKLPTIKQMVMVVLKDYPEGLLALDILTKINERYNGGYSRTSLSPQLSRLRRDNQVHKRGKHWALGPSRFSKAGASDMD